MSPTQYTLLASVFYQRQQGGARKRFRAGDTVTGLSPENAARLLRIGAITTTSAADPGGLAEPAPEPAEDPEPEAPEETPDVTAEGPTRPKAAQSVEVWRTYAIAIGIPAEEAEDMTKKQLQEATK